METLCQQHQQHRESKQENKTPSTLPPAKNFIPITKLKSTSAPQHLDHQKKAFIIGSH
jgi:hypothetical protein